MDRSKNLAVESISVVAVVLSMVVALVAIAPILKLTLNTATAVGLGILSSLIGAFLGYSYLRLKQRVTVGKVFLSHSVEDAQFVRELVNRLREDRFNVLLPEETIQVGENISDKLEQTLKEADAVVALISPSSVRSKWVSKEIDLARQNQLAILPVLSKDAELPEEFKEIKAVRLDEPQSEAYFALLRGLRNAVAHKKEADRASA